MNLTIKKRSQERGSEAPTEVGVYAGRRSRWLSGCLALLGALILPGVSLAETSPNGRVYDVKEDGIYYKLNSAGSEYMVVDADLIETLHIPATVGVGKTPVINIASQAFENRIDIKNVIVESNLATISSYAFKGCTSLESIDISRPTSLLFIEPYAFANSTLSGEVIFPDRVKLGNNCFENTSITGIKSSGEIVFLGTNLFTGCKSLKRAELGKGDRIPKETFYNCSSLEYVKLPDGCMAVYERAFQSCSELKQVINSGSLTLIDEYAFDGCFKLEEFELPDILQTLGFYSLNGAALKSIYVPSHLQVIGSAHFSTLGDAFGTLDSLETLYFPNDLYVNATGLNLKTPKLSGGVDVYVGDKLWTEFVLPASRSEISDGAYANIRSLKKVTIEDNTKAVKVGTGAFANCSGLETVIIGSGQIEFKANAFEGCTNLSNFDLSTQNNCKAYPNKMFKMCTSLKEVPFYNITSLGEEAFYGSGIVEVDAPKITTVDNGCFGECKNLVSVNLPALESLGLRYSNRTSFDGCEKLQVLKVPALKSLHEKFAGCIALKEVDFSSIESLERDGTLSDCIMLEELDMPKLKALPWYTNDLPPNLRRASFASLEQVSGTFEDLEKLESIKLPLLKVVYTNCFKGCKSLKDIDFSNFEEIGDNAFSGCSSLTDVKFGPLTKLGWGAFANCTSINQLIIPETVKSLGNAPFKGCSGLKKMDIMGDVLFFPDNLSGSFSGEGSELIFHGNVTFPQDYQYKYMDFNTNLNKLTFLKDVGYIPTNAFKSECMTSVTFLGKVEGFDQKAFNCPNIEEIKIGDMESWLTARSYNDGSPAAKATSKTVNYIQVSPDGVETLIDELVVENGIGIRQDAFLFGTIKKVTIMPSENPSIIGKGAFYYSDLGEISIGDGVTTIGQSAFEGSNLKSIVMPESVTTVQDYAFQHNLSLESITISPNIKNLPVAFLANCPSLKHLNIPEGVETIGFGLLSVYDNIKFISLPSTLKSLSMHYRYGTFHNLKTDFEIYCYSMEAPAINIDDFTNVTVHVPANALQSYKLIPQWSKANLVGDLNVDHTCATSGTTLKIEVPVSGVDADNKVERYEVLCYPLDESGNRLEPERFVFDADGNPVNDEEEMSQTRRVAKEAALRGTFIINGLNANTEYDYEIKGYAADQSLVYAASGSAKTSDVSTSVEEIDFDSVGSDATFFNLNGNRLGCGYESLAPGIYICKTPKGTFKIRK